MPGLLALALAAALPGCRPGAPPAPENVLLVSLDTTRRDHMSVYGYPRPTTPHLDAIAEGCAVFEAATAQSTITKPSHASIFTGLYPHTHGVGGNTQPLAERFVTLGEVLAERGFQTGAFVSGFPLKKDITGLVQGFGTWDSRFRSERRDGVKTTDRALDWLAELPAHEPWFLFLHYYDAHGPYRAPAAPESGLPPLAGRGPLLDFIPEYQQLEGPDGEPLRHLGDYVDRYDALVRKQDALVGRVLEAIDRERTLLVVTADHGETLGDREAPLNLNHGTSVFEEQTAIPLLVCGPGVVPGRYRDVVESVDIMPTVLDLLEEGLSGRYAFEGRSLVPLLRGAAGSPDDPAFASNKSIPETYAARGYRLDGERLIHSVRRGRWKLIRYPGIEGDVVELYDLATDPGEQRNRAAEEPAVAESLGRLLDEWVVAEPNQADSLELGDEERQRLEALGYLGD